MHISENVNSILKIISKYGKEGDSRQEIDTKEEYEYLGDFLNGNTVSIGQGFFCGTEYKYTDLSVEDKKFLFDKMKSLETKFGPWKNKFDKNEIVNIGNFNIYIDRYTDFQDKIASFESDSERNNYYEEIKDELKMIESKINAFLKKCKIETKLNDKNIDDIKTKVGNITYDLEINDFLKNYKKDFKITFENAGVYSDLLKYISEDFTPTLVKQKDYEKALDILKKAFIEFLEPYSDEKPNYDNVTKDIRHKVVDTKNKAGAINTEQQIKMLLDSNGDNFKVSEKNMTMLSEMTSYLSEDRSIGILSEEERKRAAKLVDRLWNNIIPKYLSNEECNLLSRDRMKVETNDRVRKEENGTYKKYESKIAEVLHNKDSFQITEENAEIFAKVLGYLQEKRLESSMFSEEEFKQAQDILTNTYLKFLEPQDWCGEPYTVEIIAKYDFINDALNNYEKLKSLKKSGELVQKAINNPYDKTNLKNATTKYIKENNVQSLQNIPDGIDLGNGKFDRLSTQKNENCWAHAGINSSMTVAEGKTLVETNYYRDENTGVVAVHIPEAEMFGLHDGIFIVTPQEIINAQNNVASGEGDITAYIVAIQKYFDEVNSNPKLKEKLGSQRLFSQQDEGNFGFRFYELMTASKYTEISSTDNIKESAKIQQGISTSTYFDANILYKMIENKEGVMTISLRDMAHNISIVGVKDGKFLIQESNNTPDIFDEYIKAEADERIFTKEPEINGRPTFGITIKDLNYYKLGAINYIKFK